MEFLGHPRKSRLEMAAQVFKELIEASEAKPSPAVESPTVRLIGRTALPPDIQAQIDMPEIFGPNAL